MSHIFQSYKAAWHFLLKHKSIILVLYGFNLVFAILSIGPFKSYLETVFAKSDSINTLASRFDYNIIMDVVNEYGLGIGMTFSAFISYFIMYTLWSTFATAGFLGMYQKSLSEGHSKIKEFWSSGITFFFKFLRLNIYVLIIYAAVIALLAVFFMKDGLDVFKMESEETLVSRFWILLGLFFIIGFFISIFRDVSRSKIIILNPMYIHKTNQIAFKSIFKPKYILLSLINLFFLGIICLVFCILKGSSLVWLAFLISQLYLLFRLCYRVVRGCSFLEEENDSHSKLISHRGTLNLNLTEEPKDRTEDHRGV